MRISKEKRDKIAEQILAFLFQNSPKLFFTVDIAREVARDEEFIKNILLELEKKKVLTAVKKNPDGEPYTRRTRWGLSDKVYDTYKQLSDRGIQAY
ncbi:hypothetical protein HZA33_01780 [Candidatus Pacearchaeota archaeon]|nr:hypothetical protein [Candidatus Pacearchaeota archaeon]